MTVALALRCRDGVLLATDGKVTRASTSYRSVARIWQLTNKTHLVEPNTLVAGAGELALIHAVVAALDAAPEAEREAGALDLAARVQTTLVEERAAGIARHVAIYGPEGRDAAPKAYFLLAQATPEPCIVYVSEDGDIEDQTHLGYAVVGSGDLIVHVRMQPYDPRELSVEQGAILAFGLIKDLIDSGTFRVSDPVQIWSARKGEAPTVWDEERLEKTAERYHAFRRGVHDLLRSA